MLVIKRKCVQIYNDLLMDMEDDRFLLRLIFNDEAMFHVSGKVNRNNVHIWELQNPHEIIEHETHQK